MLKKIIALSVMALAMFCVNAYADTLVEQNLDYSDSLDSFDNPERGFYRPRCMHLKQSGNTPLSPTENLVHLRVDISEFSSNAVISETDGTYGESSPISEDALKALGDTIANIKAKGHTVIIRVCYDPWYNGKSNYEPAQSLILSHLSQLASVYNQYADVIAYIELGMYGPWGEMHTSSCCTQENVSQAIDTLLNATDDTIKIGVRTPNYIAYWLGVDYADFDVNSDTFKNAVKNKSNAYRLGMFNDGYLGSSSDLGTFTKISRQKGVEWLNEFAKYTLYGGEAVADSSGNIIGSYNTSSYLAEEGFKTHTSYLNIEWNDKVIAKWKEEIYNKDDEYKGQTGFLYINNHLGYRFILKGSKLPENVALGNNLNCNLSITNVGFGNIVNSKKLTIVLKNSNGDILEFPTEKINPCDFMSQTTSQISPSVALPNNMATGEWSVYLRISKYGDLKTDNNYQCIRFGNSSSYWDSETGANYIGKINVVNKPSSEFEFDESSGEITAYLGTSDFISVPEKINNVNITKISENAFANAKKVFVPNSIKEIATDAFAKDAVIFCNLVSPAHNFAVNNNYTYVILGDVDNDKIITSTDAALTLLYVKTSGESLSTKENAVKSISLIKPNEDITATTSALILAKARNADFNF